MFELLLQRRNSPRLPLCILERFPLQSFHIPGTGVFPYYKIDSFKIFALGIRDFHDPLINSSEQITHLPDKVSTVSIAFSCLGCNCRMFPSFPLFKTKVRFLILTLQPSDIHHSGSVFLFSKIGKSPRTSCFHNISGNREETLWKSMWNSWITWEYRRNIQAKLFSLKEKLC